MNPVFTKKSVLSESLKRNHKRRRTYHVSIMNFAPNDVADHAIEALKRRMSELGFVEGQNLKIQRDHAQGDIGLIPQVLQKLDQSETDLIVTLSTPCLTAATTTIKTNRSSSHSFMIQSRPVRGPQPTITFPSSREAVLSRRWQR